MQSLVNCPETLTKRQLVELIGNPLIQEEDLLIQDSRIYVYEPRAKPEYFRNVYENRAIVITTNDSEKVYLWLRPCWNASVTECNPNFQTVNAIGSNWMQLPNNSDFPRMSDFLAKCIADYNLSNNELDNIPKFDNNPYLWPICSFLDPLDFTKLIQAFLVPLPENEDGYTWNEKTRVLVRRIEYDSSLEWKKVPELGETYLFNIDSTLEIESFSLKFEIDSCELAYKFNESGIDIETDERLQIFELLYCDFKLYGFGTNDQGYTYESFLSNFPNFQFEAVPPSVTEKGIIEFAGS